MKTFALLPSLVWRWTALDESQHNEEGSLLALLAAIAETGSVAQAARDGSFSYRHAWGLVRRWEERLGQPLVAMARGRGSSLAPLGLRLVRLDARLKSQFAVQLAEAREEARCELQPCKAGDDKSLRLSLHASHDPMLARLPEALRGQGVTLETHVLGSSESLAALAAGRCDLAGFHCPQGPLGDAVWQAYRRHLDARAHVLISFARRSQGLMLTPQAQQSKQTTAAPADPPARIQSLRDLSRPGVRFVNRQAGSGTRLLFDLLLAESGVRAQDIDGYATEEFTHAAVAATIASGGADAGLGVEAAARRFGLDFVPLAREDYYLATRRANLTNPALRALLECLASPEWRSTVAAAPGYDFADSGKLVECHSAWRSAKRGMAHQHHYQRQ